jgi:hypothetical protein
LPGCPRTWCAWPISPTDFFCLAASIAVFARTFQKYRSSTSKSSSIFLNSQTLQNHRYTAHGMVFQGLQSEDRESWILPFQEIRQKASRNAQISKIDRRKRARATKAHRGISPGSCNGLFSEGFPTGVRGTCLARPYEPALQPASRFPLGAGPKATGKQTAHVQLPKSSTDKPRLQIS